MRSPAHHDRAEILGTDEPTNPAVSRLIAMIIILTMVIVCSVLPARDAEDEATWRNRDVQSARIVATAMNTILATCPRGNGDAHTAVIFVNDPPGGTPAVDHCTRLQARAVYRPSIRRSVEAGE
jgi:hypothetical protein